MDSLGRSPGISVITATKNVEAAIKDLYASLKQQSYPHFEWIVMDGQSSDSTWQLLRQFAAESAWVRAYSEPDCGIYDALNKGIVKSAGEFYVVAGADDRFDKQALERYSHVSKTEAADVVLANVVRAGTVIGGFKPGRAWLGHSKAFKGSHSVGMLFRKTLHEKYGMYSANRFRLLADGYFLKLLLKSRQVRFVQVDFVAGMFGHGGVSSLSKLQTLVETWQIQMLTERFRLLQTALFIGKLIVRYPSVAREIETMTR